MYINYNRNPEDKNVGDCTVRAISQILNQSWEQTYVGIMLEGFMLYDMPSANHIWGTYLRHKGFTRKIIPNNYPESYSVKDFCEEHPQGMYLLALSGHVVCVIDGDYYDTWDSGDEIPLYYWEKVSADVQ